MEDSGLPDTQFHLLLQRQKTPRLPPAPGTTSSEPEKVCSAQGQGETHAWGRRADGAYTWVKILPGKSRRVHVTGPEDQSGILSLQSAGAGPGGGEQWGAGVVGGTAGQGSRRPGLLGGAQTLHSATRERLSFFNAFNVFQMVRCWLRWSPEAVLVAEGTLCARPCLQPLPPGEMP